MKDYRAIGVISGTSMDAIDVAMLTTDGKARVERGPGSTLAWPGDDHPICDPIVMLLPAYAAIEAAARRRGLDPDNPPHLQKVTQTL